MDPTKYNEVIRKFLSHFNIPKEDREDYMQECYLELLKMQKNLEKGVEQNRELEYAGKICKNRILDLLGARSRRIHAHSLDDPRTMKEAIRLQEWHGFPNLTEAIGGLPPQQKSVIRSLFVEGKTQEEAAAELKLTRKVLRNQMNKGIANLKKFFGEPA